MLRDPKDKKWGAKEEVMMECIYLPAEFEEEIKSKLLRSVLKAEKLFSWLYSHLQNKKALYEW